MTAHLWLTSLPPSDEAFAPLQRAEWLSDPEDVGALAFGHRQAVLQAAWGKSPAELEAEAERLREVAAAWAERNDDHSDDAGVHAAELEALGFALGITSALYAIRVHDAAQAEFGVAS